VWTLGLLAAAFALLRLLYLDADPSGLLSVAFLTDEGWYSQAARNHAVFGRFILDEHNVALVLCPLHTLLLRLSYALFGVSFWSTRVVGALASALTVGLVAWRLRSRPAVAAMAAALVATQPILFGLSRAAFCESLQLFFVALTWVAAADERRRRGAWVLAGAASGLAVVAKGSALYAPILALAAPLLTPGRGSLRSQLREVAWVVAGGLLVAVPFLLFEWPVLDVLRLESSRETTMLGLPPRGIWPLLLLGLTEDAARSLHPAFWAGLFPLLIVAGFVLSRRLASGEAPAPVTPAARLAAVWLALSLGLASLELDCARALDERYWMNLLVPLACLTATGVLPPSGVATLRWRRWAAAMVLGGVALIATRQVMVFAVSQKILAGHLHRAPFLLLEVAIAGLTTLASLRLRVPERLLHLTRPWPVVIAAAALSSALVSAGIVAMPTYTLRDTARALTADGVPKVLTGDTANSLSLETSYRAFVRRDLALMHLGRGWINQDWRALGATHWVTDRPTEAGPPERPVPDAVLLSAYPTWPNRRGQPRRTVYVFALPTMGVALAPRSAD
jgi:4-amino-4-deoxy-L-arabinose transferase-like glycosyltransferase